MSVKNPTAWAEVCKETVEICGRLTRGADLTTEIAEALMRQRAIGAANELVALGQWIDESFEMGADRSQVADPVIRACRDVHSRICMRIAELKESK